MQKNLKTISVAIPKKQFRQILEFMEQKTGNGKKEVSVASFLREAIGEFLIRRGYEEINVEFAARQGRPARRR